MMGDAMMEGGQMGDDSKKMEWIYYFSIFGLFNLFKFNELIIIILNVAI